MPRVEESRKKSKRKADSSSSDDDDRKKKKDSKKSKNKTKKSRRSSYTSTDSESSYYKKKSKHKKLKRKKSKDDFAHKHKSKKKLKDLEGASAAGPSIESSHVQTKGPMTKEMWEKQQSVVRRVFDVDTGRTRLVKGSGEIIEEIVSKQQQKQINKLATQGDGISYSIQTGTLR